MNLAYLDASFGPSRYGRDEFGDFGDDSSALAASTDEVPAIIGGLVAAGQEEHSSWPSMRVGVATGVIIHLMIKVVDAIGRSLK